MSTRAGDTHGLEALEASSVGGRQSGWVLDPAEKLVAVLLEERGLMLLSERRTGPNRIRLAHKPSLGITAIDLGCSSIMSAWRCPPDKCGNPTSIVWNSMAWEDRLAENLKRVRRTMLLLIDMEGHDKKTL